MGSRSYATFSSASLAGAEVGASDNAQLASLTGLDALVSIGEELFIEDNDVLVDVTALYGLTDVGDDVTIRDNIVLTDAAAQALADEIDTIGGIVTISGN